MTYVSGQVFLKTKSVADTGLARRLAAVVVENDPEALKKDTIQINMIYGYDIGIAASWSRHAHNFNPLEFQGLD